MEKNKYTKPVVVVDCDGVVADYWHSASKILKKMFGIPLYPLSGFEAQGWGLDWLGLTKEHEDKFWEAVRNDPEPFWENEREMRYGIVKKFYELKHLSTFYWCTTREDTKAGKAQEQTAKFLERYGFWGPQVVVSGRKDFFCLSVQADYFMDDKFDNCAKVYANCAGTRVYFLAQPGQLQHEEEARSMGMNVIYDPEIFIAEIMQNHG